MPTIALLSPLVNAIWSRLRAHEEARAALLADRMGSTRFFGSQVGGQTVINYSYTDLPSRLLMWDIYYFFQFAWALPWVLMPVTPSDSGELDELAPTWPNIFCVVLHAVLCVLQLVFILSLPVLAFLPVYIAGAVIAGFLVMNWALCLMLNGPTYEYHSDPKYAEAKPEHAHEQWIFLNGVAVGDHWMKNNLNRLALTFKRPVLGIHNQTSGILFDVVECLVQRNFGYATFDVRMAYRIVKKHLYDPELSKVVFILHSQGGIEGGLVLDWLLQELPQDLLRKLEVYTFGNAANHFNNPHRHAYSQALVKEDPAAAVSVAPLETTVSRRMTGFESPKTMSPITRTPSSSFKSDGGQNGNANISTHPNGNGAHKPNGVDGKNGTANTNDSSLPSLRQESTSTSFSSSLSTPLSAAQDRALGHVEHYAHTTDFVALWGVLHFCTSAAAHRSMPRFIGRLFARASDRGGHQFCQHYLDGMFPLARDPDTGDVTGCAEDNEFMDSEVSVGSEGSAGQNAREAFEVSWMGDGGFGSGDVASEVEVHLGEDEKARRQKAKAKAKSRKRKSTGKVKVKDLSRLWLYRNGRSPSETPPFLAKENGVARNATM